MAWTRFMDMHSGGGQKEKFSFCFIEAPEDEARVIFYNRFGHSPDRVSCTCCGEDYSADGAETLAEASGYDRGCKYDVKKKRYVEEPDLKAMSWNPYMTLTKFRKRKDICIIPKRQIRKADRQGECPTEGYVWM